MEFSYVLIMMGASFMFGMLIYKTVYEYLNNINTLLAEEKRKFQ